MTEWHLVLDDRCPSRLNMARDLALFQSVLAGAKQGVVRVYNWDEPAVTVGFHQKTFETFDPDLFIPIVKRPTGGGAVLHYDDITFSISAPEGGRFPQGIAGATLKVSEIFCCALRSCGLDAEIRGDHTGFSEVCFQRSSPVELSLAGTKIMGLALLRHKGHFLIQGVIPLRVHAGLSEQVFGTKLAPGILGIHDHCPAFDLEIFVKKLVHAFSSEGEVALSQDCGDDEDQHHGDQ